VHDGAWGVVGFLCIWIGGLFWLATAPLVALHACATYGHIRDTLLAGNYAPYNFLTIFSDGFIAVWLLVLLYLYHRGEASSSKADSSASAGCHRGRYPRYTPVGRLAAGAFLANRVRSGRKQPQRD